MISETIYKRALLLYYYKKKVKAVDAAKEICAAEGENAMPESTAREWFRRFHFEGTDLNALIEKFVTGFAKALHN